MRFVFESAYMKNLSKLVQLPYTFVLMNYAVVAGLACFLKGHQNFWDSVRMEATPESLRQH
jgi:hypothetical protein